MRKRFWWGESREAVAAKNGGAVAVIAGVIYWLLAVSEGGNKEMPSQN